MKSYQDIQHVFIIGCKGIPARYGGFETFVDKLAQYQLCRGIRYHVACAVEPQEDGQANRHFYCHHADCVNIPWRDIGPARAVAYDIDALCYFLHYVQKKQIAHPVFYILACRIGPFIRHFKKRIDALGGRLLVNPDGHEFLRAKWSAPVRRYWKYSERLMVRYADLLVCDSKTIQAYIRREYTAYGPKTVYIAYGAEGVQAMQQAPEVQEKLSAWYAMHNLREKEYYLIVGRFVPENNYETMLREYMRSDTDKPLAIITDVNSAFFEKLKKRTRFDTDARIRFTGTVYDQELLRKIRENAYAYLHGHEVGGTNPSLLEALALTDLNLLLDVGFNRETAKGGACYWTKQEGDLAALIHRADHMPVPQVHALAQKAHKRIADNYSWELITQQYEQLFSRRGYTCAES